MASRWDELWVELVITVMDLKKDYDNVVLKIEKLENKMLKLKLDITGSDNQRKDKIIAKQDLEIDETKKVNVA